MKNYIMEEPKETGLKEQAKDDENTSIPEEQDGDELQHEDYSSYSKEDLLAALEKAELKNNAQIKEIKSNFDNIIATERDEALQKFIETGGEEGDFKFKKDKTVLQFEKTYDGIKDKQKQNFSNQEKDKDNNLKAKNALLEKLREIISQEETQKSIISLKDIQEEWKKIGPVPQAQAQNMWNNYNALIERFYSNRSIYFELKELDRKKNLETKKEICDKAEKLLEIQHLPTALKELKALHDEFKHIGPVPKEDQEALWNRFKTASDKIYEKRSHYNESLKKQQEEHYKKKLAIAEKTETYATFTSEKIDDWKAKTAEVLALQTEWKAAGGVTQDQTKELSKKFWPNCKKFFHNKDQFFKKLESKKDENLKLKIELCEKAEAVKDSDDYVETAKVLKNLQKSWEDIGPVPIKQKEAIFKRFKAACDAFFSRKREQSAEAEKQYVDNLQKKLALIEQIEKLSESADKDTAALKKLQAEWSSIGFVPKDDIKTIQHKYNAAIDKYLDSIEKMGGEDKETLKLSLQVEASRNSPEAGKKLHKKEGDIHRKVTALKHEINTWTTNMDFLGRSAAAEKLKKEMQEKIQHSQNELKALQAQLKIIKGA
jgi:hypothetical protein